MKIFKAFGLFFSAILIPTAVQASFNGPDRFFKALILMTIAVFALSYLGFGLALILLIVRWIFRNKLTPKKDLAIRFGLGISVVFQLGGTFFTLANFYRTFSPTLTELTFIPFFAFTCFVTYLPKEKFVTLFSKEK